MAKIIFNPNVVFNGSPKLCQLLCDSCKKTYCGAWRNDWISVECRECWEGQVVPVISEAIFRIMFEPARELLN